MTVMIEKKIDRVDGPVVMSVEFKSELELSKKIIRAAHKSDCEEKSSKGVSVMKFVYSKKSAVKGAVDRIKDRFGKSVKVEVAAYRVD